MSDWSPDMHMIESAKAGKLDVKLMDPADRSWVVAGLGAAGHTAEDIATLLSCSLRLIRQIRAEPMTVVSTYAMNQAVEMTRMEQRHRSAIRASQNDRVAADARAERFRTQRDELIRSQERQRQRVSA